MKLMDKLGIVLIVLLLSLSCESERLIVKADNAAQANFKTETLCIPVGLFRSITASKLNERLHGDIYYYSDAIVIKYSPYMLNNKYKNWLGIKRDVIRNKHLKYLK